MIALAAIIGVCLAIAITAPRLFAGPTLYDRALAAHSIAIKAAIVCAALAVAAARAAWVDAAFALIFAVFVAHAAVLKFFRARSFQPPLAPGEAL